MNIAKYIDHTTLKPNTTREAIEVLCKEANQYGFAAVCVPPYFIHSAKKNVHESVQVATVIGFPFGYSSIEAKKAEIAKAIKDEADELDMVINLCALFSNDWDYLRKEILECLKLVRLHQKKIKIIIESGLLSQDQIVKCCHFYATFKVDYLKTSTGYAEKGADVATIQLIRGNLPQEIKIKASGGIRTFAFAKELIEAGADRIGASSSTSIFQN